MDAQNAPENTQPLDELNAEQALFDRRIDALVATFSSDQRPLKGLAGLLDWRFQGAISHCLKQGFLTGKAGECAYLPMTRAGETYHLILVGRGPARSESYSLPEESLKALKKNLDSLKLPRVGVSRADVGNSASQLEGLPVCLLR